MKVLRRATASAVAAFTLLAVGAGPAVADPSTGATGSGTTVNADLAHRGHRIDNKYTDLVVWNYAADWTTAVDDMPSDYYAEHYPEVKRVQLMTATGGCYIGYPGCGADRDLFENPADRSTTTDYDFTPLMHALHNIVREGLRPYIVTGNVPIKFTAHPEIGNFGVNIRPPDDYKAYAAYIGALVRAAVSKFGLAEVRGWRWGVLTEYENTDWFSAADGTPRSTAKAYFKLYDHTAKALSDVLGKGKVDIGAHSMTNGDGLWDERLFIDHVAKGHNYATGGTGAPIRFLSFSYYDTKPGKGSSEPYTFKRDLATLRKRAIADGLIHVEFGIDEGRMLLGSDGRELDPRSVAWSYQSALDASRYLTMVDEGVSWFSRWYVNTDRYYGAGTEVDPVGTNFTKLAAKLVGSRILASSTTGTPRGEKDQVDGLAGYNARTGTLNVLVYNRSDDTSATTSEPVTIDIANVAGVGHGISARQWRIDDRHANFWPTWEADMNARGMTSASFGERWSRDGWTIPGDLANKADRRYWFSRVPTYRKLAALKAEPVKARILGSKLVLSGTLAPQGVALYQITGVRPGR